jgi:FMN phosphatase YigB (HAD superfamily)
VRPLRLADIDAVGFDLDHTLAVYDDARVNALAYEETRELLAAAGRADLAARLDVPYDESRVCRGLLLDTAAGTVVKADARSRVRRARRAGAWMTGTDIASAYPAALDTSSRFHPIHSPFDLPTAFMYQHLAAPGADSAGLCTLIRRELDRAHTRGRFKRRVCADIERLVRPLPAGTAPFERLRAAGKTLFVLTNSEADYAAAVLDRLFGPHWKALFDTVVSAAAKPDFFGTAAARLEASLGITDPARILYAGDSVMSDIVPARRRGWRTAGVVQELSGGDRDGGDWGPALVDDTGPTWFAAAITGSADVYAASVGDLIGAGAQVEFTPGPHPLGAGADGDCP